ncbi:MAG TPA: Ku protein [Actinomycetota bacterium]|nr:Ku protein [Actinomycetota bacterium]
MPRAVWTGSLSFGLVSIPVALYPATQPKDVRFHLFDRQGRRVRYRRFAEEPESRSTRFDDVVAGPTPERPRADDRVGATPPDAPDEQLDDEPASARALAYDELVRGYEVEPGRFAMVERDEIEQVGPSRSSTIDMEDFVELDAIDPVYFEKSYYLAPRRDADTPYRLLQRVLERTRRAGIGRFVLRTKPHLVAVRPIGHVLGLETLFFGDEVRDSDDVVALASGDLSDRELRLAEQLVEVLATAWEPERYADEYRRDLLRIISEKPLVETDAAADVARAPASTSRAEELMEALRRSVEEAKAAQDPPAAPRRRRTG